MLNVSLGVLGHVDSGKTSLCKALSTTVSTAAFDSNPQSVERGITLDLGFSSFQLGDKWNCTLVDCPGHASLIRTVIGGAQIMDIMLLVVDINKGMQPQTAECLILANITSNHLLVLLNKVDLISVDKREAKIKKIKSLMNGVLLRTKFRDVPIVPVSALDPSIGTEGLRQALLQKLEITTFVRDKGSPFLMAIDHCFSKKGQGTVLTGTIIQGQIKLNEEVEIPTLRETKKVKSMQAFHVPVKEAGAGDRLGICVAGLDASLLERTVISSPKLIPTSVRVMVMSLEKISYFRRSIRSRRRYHISMGYDTYTANVTIARVGSGRNSRDEYVEELAGDVSGIEKYIAVAEFDRLAMVLPNALVIGSDLQSEAESNCRLAFSGRILQYSEDKSYETTFLPTLNIFRWKEKQGFVDRVQGASTLIVKGFCSKESSVEHLLYLNVGISLPDGLTVHGRIAGRFGQTDKLRVELTEPLTAEQMKIFDKKEKDKCFTVHLRYGFKHFNKGEVKKLIQSI